MSGLADILAGMGQVYGGYSRAEVVDQQRRRDELAQQEALQRLGEARRLSSYNDRVAAGARDFLPGGAQATTVMTPGEGAVIPATPVDDEGNAMPTDLGKAKPVETANRLGALEFMHNAALEAGLPDKADGIDKRIRAFKDEGLEETARAILSGASEDEIRDAFNRQGKVKFSRVQRIPGSDSQVIGITEDGRATQFDAKNIVRSLMGPKDYFAYEDRERDNVRRDNEASARAKYWTDLGSAAVTRANAAGKPRPAAPKAPDPIKERADRRKFSADARKYAADLARDDEGKLDPERANQIAGLASLMADADPELLADPLAAAQAAQARLADLQAQATAKAVREWSTAAKSPRASLFGYDENPDPESFEVMHAPDGTREDKQTFVARRAREIVNSLLAQTARRDNAGSAQAQQPQGATRIQSDDEWRALPKGALYVGPDGVLRRKS